MKISVGCKHLFKLCVSLVNIKRTIKNVHRPTIVFKVRNLLVGFVVVSDAFFVIVHKKSNVGHSAIRLFLLVGVVALKKTSV